MPHIFYLPYVLVITETVLVDSTCMAAVNISVSLDPKYFKRTQFLNDLWPTLLRVVFVEHWIHTSDILCMYMYSYCSATLTGFSVLFPLL
jgi:hypothetical protein